MFLRHQFIVLLDADVAVFPQCELAVSTGIQVGDQRFHDFAPAVFIPDARINGLLVGRDIGFIALFCASLGQRHDFEQVTLNGRVLPECDVCMVESIYIVKPDAPGAIGADQLCRPLLTPLKAGVRIRRAQIGQNPVVGIAEQQVV